MIKSIARNHRIVRTIKEPEFTQKLYQLLDSICHIGFRSVSGPGRSGAIASVYTSHYLGIPFITNGANIIERLQPHLIIDTASESGKTLRKAMRKAKTPYGYAAFEEPPRVRFWYESEVVHGKMKL